MSNNSSTKTTNEVHLFIIWEHARTIEQKIISDISKKFRILKIYEVHWSKDKFSENLSRFYGTQLPPNSKKEVHVGTNPFLAIIVEDNNPVYEVHTTTKGDKKVNTKLFTSKSEHREWTGGGHKIHASNTTEEADHNLTLLFGKNSKDFIKSISNKSSLQIEEWHNDLAGSNGWDSLEQLFYVLNNTIKYVVLRNFDPLPNNYYSKNHGDIDLLVSNYDDARFITNATSVFKKNYRVYSIVKIAEKKIFFDFRHLDDNYYDKAWEEHILNYRKFKKCFYIPSEEDYFYSLLYHAIIQKPELSSDYKKNLVALAKTNGIKLSQSSFKTNEAIDLLSNFLSTNNYSFTQPNDKSVYFHSDNIRRGVSKGVKFKRKKIVPLRNYLKKHKVPVKHYFNKSKKIVRRQLKKLQNEKK